MYRLVSDIQIGDYTFKKVHKVVIESSTKVLADTCKITIPTTGILKQQQTKTSVELAKAIKVGDPVTVKLGYNEDLKTEFEGFVQKMDLKTPLTIFCEDMTYLLKRTKLEKKTYQKTTLKQLLNDVLKEVKEYGITISEGLPELTLEPFYIKEGTTIAMVLQTFIDQYGLTIYFDGLASLSVGLSDKGSAIYHFQKNVIDNKTEFVTKDQSKVLIKAVGISEKNEKIEVETGDPDGAVRTLFFYFKTIDQVKSQLEKLAKDKLEQYKYDGLRGSITGFLQPYCKSGYVAEVVDDIYKDRTGNYWIDSVTTTFGQNGGRRNIELGMKL